MGLHIKDPGAVVDQAMDWSDRPDGLSVVASTWSVAPDEAGGLAVDTASFTAQATRVRLSGGVVGRVYRLTNRVTLSDGQVDERSLTIRVEER